MGIFVGQLKITGENDQKITTYLVNNIYGDISDCLIFD